MAENDFSKNFDAFLQMQNQTMEMWKKAGQNTSPQTNQNPWSTNPWAAMGNFWSSTPGQNSASSQMFGNIFDQNTMMSQLTKCFETIAGAANNTNNQTPEQWQTLLNKSLDDLQAQLSKMSSVPFSAAPDFSDSFNGLFTTWQQSMPGVDFTTAETTNFSMPGLGPDREKFEKLQNLQLLAKTYQSAQQEYTQSFSTFWQEVIDKLKVKISQAVETEEIDLTSTRALYDQWVDAAEEIYGKTTRTDSHQKCYSKMVNASMALKQAFNDLQQDALANSNVPTRKEIDTLSERLQSTRRENRLLRKELDELKAAFEKSQKNPAKEASPKKTVKKKAVKKKTSTKKRK